MLILAWIFLSSLTLLVKGPPTAYFLAVGKDLFVLGLILAAIFLGLPALGHQPAVQTTLNRIAWKIPWPGSVYRDHIRSVLCRLLSAHLDAGLPLPQSIQSAVDATGDEVLGERGQRALDDIQKGSGMSSAFIAAGILPPNDGMLVESGERSGNVPGALSALGGSYEERAQRGLMSLVAMGGAFIGLMGFVYIALSILDAFQTVMSGTDQIMDTIQRESGIEHR